MSGPAAFDRHDGAGDRGRIVRGQEQAKRRDLGYGHELLGRLGGQEHILDDLLFGDPARLGGVRYLLFDQRGEHVSGANRIDGDALLGNFQRDRLGQAGDAVLGGDIGGFIGEATRAWADATLMMRPHLRSFIACSARRIV